MLAPAVVLPPSQSHPPVLMLMLALALLLLLGLSWFCWCLM